MKRIINLLITLVIAAIVYYFTLPAINLNNMGFYIFIFFIIILYAVLNTISATASFWLPKPTPSKIIPFSKTNLRLFIYKLPYYFLYTSLPFTKVETCPFR